MLHKTRIAPTPSGYLHIGNICSFALTATLAERYGARILLRIDDLDRERVRDAYLDDIFETLDFMGLPFDEGPRSPAALEQNYSQRYRLSFYETLLQQLAAAGKVFACDCSRATLLQDNPQGVYRGACRHKALPLDQPGLAWRLDTGEDIPLSVQTPEGEISAALPEEMHYFIVRRKDGVPAYQLASVADDLSFGVDLVVRGADLWPSTLAQLYLAASLGLDNFRKLTFYHHVLLHNEDGEKLSKSAGDIAIRHLRQSGKTAPEVYAAIGRQLGLKETVGHWRELGTAVLAGEG